MNSPYPQETLPLATLLDRHEDGIATLESAESPPTRVAYSTLMTRDRIHRLAGGNPFTELDEIERLHGLDRRLIKCADRLTDYSFLDKCRQTYRASPSAWWWHLQSRATPLTRSRRFGWAWGLGTLVCVLGSATFIFQTAKAFSTQGFDAVGTLGTLAQSAGLALVAGGAATERGRKQFDRILMSVNVPGHRTAEASFVLSAGLLAVSYWVNANLDRLGDYYLAQAQRQIEAENLSRAIGSYERALQFGAPNEALLEQGKLYERLGDYEAAIAAYDRGSLEDLRFTDAKAYALLLQRYSDSAQEFPIPKKNLRDIQLLLDRARLVVGNIERLKGNSNELILREAASLIYTNYGLLQAVSLILEVADSRNGQNILDKESSERLFALRRNLSTGLSIAFLGAWPPYSLEEEAALANAIQEKTPSNLQKRALCLSYELNLRVALHPNLATNKNGRVTPFQINRGQNMWFEFTYYCPELLGERATLFNEIQTAAMMVSQIEFPEAPQEQNEVDELPESIEAVRQRLQSQLQAAVDETPIAEDEAPIMRLGTDARGYVRHYYIYRNLHVGTPVTVNSRVEELWREDAQQPQAPGEERTSDQFQDRSKYHFQAEFSPDGKVAVYPLGNVYPMLDEETKIDGLEVVYPTEIDASRRHILKGMTNEYLHTLKWQLLDTQTIEWFSEPLEYRLTVAIDGAIVKVEPIDDRARDSRDRTVLSQVRETGETNLPTTTFILRVKGARTFLLFDCDMDDIESREPS